jgi:hypothetical protein
LALPTSKRLVGAPQGAAEIERLAHGDTIVTIRLPLVSAPTSVSCCLGTPAQISQASREFPQQTRPVAPTRSLSSRTMGYRGGAPRRRRGIGLALQQPEEWWTKDNSHWRSP